MPPPAAAVPRRAITLGRAGWWSVLLAGAIVHASLWLISEPPTLFSDFYKAYFPAAEVLWEHGLFTSFPFTEAGAGGFVNLPILGWLFVPLVPLGEDLAGWVFLGIGAAATVAACIALRRAARLDEGPAVALALLFLLNGPLINSLREGNTTHFVLLALVLALTLLERGREFAAGLLLGMCALVKLPLLLFAAYFLLRRRWMVVAGGAAMIGATLTLSVAAFGIANNVNWFNCCIGPFLGGIIPAFNVQSIDGFAIRLVTGTAGLADWDPMAPPAAYRVIRLVIFAVVLGAAALLAARADRNRGAASSAQRRERERLEYVLVLTLALVISPISWSHYYLLLLLPWGLFLGGQLPLGAGTRARALAWAAIGLTSLPVVALPLQPDAVGEVLARTIVSAHFAGGVAMLLALMGGLYSLGHPPRIGSDTGRM